MDLSVPVGAVVVLDIFGHSAVNGAPIPEGTTIAITSNDTTVATVPDSVTVPPGGAESLTNIPVTLMGEPGSTDIHVVATAPDGTIFEDTATLVVSTPVPGLVRIEAVLRAVV